MVRGARVQHDGAARPRARRHRREAAEAAHAGDVRRGVDGPVLVDLGIAAQEHRGVRHRGQLGRGGRVVELAGAAGAGAGGVEQVGAGDAVTRHRGAEGGVLQAGGRGEAGAGGEVVGEHRRARDVVPVVAVAGEHDVARVVRGAGHDAALLARAADQEAHFLAVAAGLGRTAHADRELHAFIVATGDDVDHAAQGVGTVDRRGAVREHFDALDRGHRDGVEVLAFAQHRGVRHAAAIEQDQGALGTDAAQADLRRAAAGAAGGGLVGTERVEAGVAQVVGHRDVAAGHDFLAADHGDRQGAFDFSALDARTGDLHRVERLGLFLVVVALRQRGQRGHEHRSRQRQYKRVAIHTA